MTPERVAARLESREVWQGLELTGYVLYEIRTFQTLTPVRCCRTCAWADAGWVRYVPGVGLAYLPENLPKRA